MPPKQDIEQLTAEIESLQAQLKERDDKISQQAVEIETLKSTMSGKKHVDMSGQIPFVAAWATPQGEKKNRKVIFRNPKVRLPDGTASVVSTVALTRLAAGKELSETELKESPALAKINAEQAGEIITKWAKINAGVLQDVE